MVKKIRLVDAPKTGDEKTSSSDGGGTSVEIMELLKSMDWKLWELLQIGQRLEKELMDAGSNTKSKSSRARALL